MSEQQPVTRSELIKTSMIFQLKLLADGLRDAILIPVSMIATLVGVLRGGSEPDREFRSVIDIGRQTEQWINLFGQHEPLEAAGSIDKVLEQVENVIRKQYSKDRSATEVESAIDQALEKIVRRTRRGTRDQ